MISLMNERTSISWDHSLVLLMFVSACKVEARSVEHMKNVARGLENKIIELQQKLTEKVTSFSRGQEQVGCFLDVFVLHCSVY